MDSKLVSKQALADHWGVGVRTIERAVESGGLPHEGSRLSLRFNLEQADAWRTTKRSRRGHRPSVADVVSPTSPADVPTVPVQEAERRKLLAEAELKEHKLRELRGQAISAERTYDLALQAFSNVRTRVRAVATTMAPRLADVPHPAGEIEVLLLQALDGALECLSMDVFEK
jgi:hypothetical protein